MRGTKVVDIHERLTDERTWTTLGRLAAGVAIIGKMLHGLWKRRAVVNLRTEAETTRKITSELRDRIAILEGKPPYRQSRDLEARVIDINSRLEGLENYGQRPTDF